MHPERDVFDNPRRLRYLLRMRWMKTFLQSELLFVLIAMSALVVACDKDKSVKSHAGLESTASGIRIVATYDSRFDNILDEYRLLSVTFVNQSPDLIELFHKDDIWTITTNSGAKLRAINNLRFVDQRAWNALSPRAQEVIEYPRVVLRNTTITFDLIFPKSVELAGFQQIDFFSAHLDQSFVGGSTYGEIPSGEALNSN